MRVEVGVGDWTKVKKVYVDGVDVTNRCFLADTLQRKAECYKHKDGHAYIENGLPATETLHGKVKIIFEQAGGN